MHHFSPLLEMGPARRDHIPTFRIALGVAIYANFGAFTGVYGRHMTRQVRLKHHVLADIALTTSVTVGAIMTWLDLSPWALMIVTALVFSV